MNKHHLGCLIKVIAVIILILAIGLIVLQCTGGSCIKKIDKTLPDSSAVPWQVTTPTHLYYAGKVEDNGVNVTMDSWWERVGGKWVKHDEQITLERRLYGSIDVAKRETSASAP